MPIGMSIRSVWKVSNPALKGSLPRSGEYPADPGEGAEGSAEPGRRGIQPVAQGLSSTFTVPSSFFWNFS
jgi:hypothetical protein